MMQTQENLARGDVTTRREEAPSAVRGGARGIPSEPLLGVLPVRRVIPQDVHSILDYSNGILVAWSGLTARKREARIASAVLGASVIGVSLLTDYRLSAAKLIPIEVHEAIDHLWSAALIAAPFALGYDKRAPLTTLVHVTTGVATILGSLFTDYRAVKGVGHRTMRARGRAHR